MEESCPTWCMVWGQITQLVRKTKLSPRAERSLIFYPISFSWLHNASDNFLSHRDLLQFLTGEPGGAIPHTFDQGGSFVISHHIARLDHIRSAYSHTSLVWNGPFPWIVIYVELGMRIIVAKPDIMSCPRRWVTVLDTAPAINSVRQQLILGSHRWVGGGGGVGWGAQMRTTVKLQTALTPFQTNCSQ